MKDKKREAGYYWVMWTDKWEVAKYNGQRWNFTSGAVCSDDRSFTEINECRLTPQSIYDTTGTWQAGGTNENYGGMLYSTAIFDEVGNCVSRSFACSYEESIERAELIARSPALSQEVAELRKENERIEQYRRDEGVKHWNQVLKQQETIKRLTEELHQKEMEFTALLAEFRDKQ